MQQFSLNIDAKSIQICLISTANFAWLWMGFFLHHWGFKLNKCRHDFYNFMKSLQRKHLSSQQMAAVWLMKNSPKGQYFTALVEVCGTKRVNVLCFNGLCISLGAFLILGHDEDERSPCLLMRVSLFVCIWFLLSSWAQEFPPPSAFLCSGGEGGWRRREVGGLSD